MSILNLSNASTLISFINCPHDRYLGIHSTLLNACMASKECKRFIPSEWAGNIDDYPLLPAFYAGSREPFRKTLQESSGIEWTIFNFGWLADYFLPQRQTYMPFSHDMFPIDTNNWRACIKGTGDETQAWTCAREVAKAVVELLAASEWVCMGMATYPGNSLYPPVDSKMLTISRNQSHMSLANGVHSTKQ